MVFFSDPLDLGCGWHPNKRWRCLKSWLRAEVASGCQSFMGSMVSN